eukprot:629220-Amphidinium_carterae.1
MSPGQRSSGSIWDMDPITLLHLLAEHCPDDIRLPYCSISVNKPFRDRNNDASLTWETLMEGTC